MPERAEVAVRRMLRGLLFSFLLAAALPVGAQENAQEFFETRVRPVLANNCYACHTDSKMGELRVDSRAAILQGGKTGAAIIPGQAQDSLLIRAVMQMDENLKMPMAGNKLKESEIEDLKQWIQMGAPWPEENSAPKPAAAGDAEFRIRPEQRNFWSFQPIRKPVVPPVEDSTWVKNPIDNFILVKLEENNLQPVRAADKRTLIRRATHDLTGLPPTPEQVEAFVADSSPGAFAKVVDRLLASPHYGERWARHWLDLARYADGEPVTVNYGVGRNGFVNVWRYRDWVIQALNDDVPYDLFVKAQFAADQLPADAREKMLPGLGFFGMGPWVTADDRLFVEARAFERDEKIDIFTKGVLGLTVACARCHDHKYDPISQKDYTALAGVFWSAGYSEYPLAPEKDVVSYRERYEQLKLKERAFNALRSETEIQVAERLAAQTVEFMMAARQVVTSETKLDPDKVAAEEKLDQETFQRWVKYLATKVSRDHSFLRDWDALMARGGGSDEEARRVARVFQKQINFVIDEHRKVVAANEELDNNYRPDPNEVTALLPGGIVRYEFFDFKRGKARIVPDTKRAYLFREVVRGVAGSEEDGPPTIAVYQYKGKEMLRFLTPEQKARLDAMQSEVKAMNDMLPPEYSYLMGLAENPVPANLNVHIRGNAHALGEKVPRGFPAVLANTDGDPSPFKTGSGRLELAEAILRHPLAARVMVNRMWMHHFGRGIVGTPSNFGVTGERPSHPELLDYLATRFVESGWSMKAMHREMMLSAAYQLSADYTEPNETLDPENKLFWHANVRRLEAEAIRDSLLFVSGVLDERVGGPPEPLTSADNKRRTIYGRIPRGGFANGASFGMLRLFDFPEPTVAFDQREVSNTPLQSLFFLNSGTVWRDAGTLAKRLNDGAAGDDETKIRNAYRLLYGRAVTEKEMELGLGYLRKEPGGESAWQRYIQALVSASEFYHLN